MDGEPGGDRPGIPRGQYDPHFFSVTAIGCELLLIPVGLLVVWAWRPEEKMPPAEWIARDAGLAVLATIPPLLLLAAITWTPMRNVGPVRRIKNILRRSFGSTLARLKLWQILAISAAAGVGEEVLFRGALQPRLGWIATSLIFGALHSLTPTYALYAAALGFYLGHLHEWGGRNLLIPIGVHALYDAIALTVVRREFRREGLAGDEE